MQTSSSERWRSTQGIATVDSPQEEHVIRLRHSRMCTAPARGPVVLGERAPSYRKLRLARWPRRQVREESHGMTDAEPSVPTAANAPAGANRASAADDDLDRYGLGPEDQDPGAEADPEH